MDFMDFMGSTRAVVPPATSLGLDYFAIVSLGVYPTPTPSDKVRAVLALSMGILNIEF